MPTAEKEPNGGFRGQSAFLCLMLPFALAMYTRVLPFFWRLHGKWFGREIIRFKVKLSVRNKRKENTVQDPSGCFPPFWFQAEFAAFGLEKADNKKEFNRERNIWGSKWRQEKGE